MMYDIYSNTQENLIYLGEDSDIAAQANVEIQKIQGNARRETEDYKTWHRVLYNADGTRKYSKSGIDVTVDFSPLIQFYSAPWFGRLWVVQEAVLSPKNTWHCDRVVGDTAEALRAAEWLEHKRFHLPVYIPADSGIFGAAGVHLYCNANPKRSYGLYNLVGGLSTFGYSEPRDQIYAVTGLHRKLTGTTSSAKRLTPNYQKPLSDVLRDATRYMIRERKDPIVLNLLTFYGCDANLGQSYPSWAPHWHIKADDDSASELANSFSADDRRGLDVGVILGNDDTNRLTLGGYIVDHVSNISSVAHKKNLSTSKGCLCILEEIQILLANTPIKVDSFVLRATLIAGENASQERATENDCAAFSILANYIKERGQLPPNITEVNRSPGKYDSTTIRTSAYDLTFYWAMENRRFFITPSWYIGLGPRTMEVSDTVAILYGCALPVILRSHGDYYTVLGPCYAHWIMDGEKVREYEAEGKRPEVIILR